MMTMTKKYYTTSLLFAIINIILLQLSIQSSMVTATSYEYQSNKQQSKESNKEESNNSNNKVISTIIHPTSSYLRYLQLQLDDINSQLLLDHTGINTQDEGAYADGNNNNRRLRLSNSDAKLIDKQHDNDDYEMLTNKRDIIQHELNIAISKIVDSGSAAYTTLMEFVPSLHDSLHDDTQQDDRLG